MELKDKRVLVVGMARSGIACCNTLVRLGAHVIASERKTKEQMGDALEGLDARCEVSLGCTPEGFYDRTDLMVISPGVLLTEKFMQEAFKRGIPVTGELELGAELTKGRLLAITGTNGKTTTTTLVGEICKAAGYPTHVVGNIGIPIMESVLETTPDTMTVCEVSSYQCETVEKFHPNVAACLNITEDHLARHGSMETYVAMKHRIFEQQTPEDAAVFNWDDPTCRKMAEDVPGRVFWFSRREQVKGAYAKDGILYLNLSEETAVIPTAEIRIPGPHNLENALAAALITGLAGIRPEVMGQVLREFPGVEHRIETVRELDGVRYINDSKGTNVDSTQKAIETMDRPTVLILGGSRKGVSYRELARSIKESPWIRECVLIGDTAADIRHSLEEAGYSRIHETQYDFDKCIAVCRTLAQPGWNVLLSPACASFDMFKDYEDRGRVFKQKVMEL